MEKKEIDKLDAMARAMRRDCIAMGLAAGGAGAHMGGSLSCVEILAALYGSVMRFGPDLSSSNNDRIVISKGHGVLAQYAALHQLGFVGDGELETFKTKGSRLTAHPAVDPSLGIDFATGSLGQGLSLAVGAASVLKTRGRPQRIYVLLGDGECDEGSVWEAVMAASQWGLDNLIAIVDANGLQYDASVSEVIALNPLAPKWESFGWSTAEADGHSIASLVSALEHDHAKRPHVVIAHTCKGKGVSFMEGNPSWHAQRVTREIFAQAMSELGGE